MATIFGRHSRKIFSGRHERHEKWITRVLFSIRWMLRNQDITSPGTKVSGGCSYQGRKRHTLESNQNLDGMTIKPFIEIPRS
jgi:hypothetical protein